MFWELVIAIIIGVHAGVFTGLIPGIHINLISVLIYTYSSIFLDYFNLISLCCFIITMAITHSYLDSIPSIYLGAPDEAMALNVLPGHRMLHQGKGHDAILYTLIGSLITLIFCVLLIPIFIFFMDILEPLIGDYIGHILALIMAYMILREKQKIWAFILFIFSGTLGLLVFNLGALKQPLFPLLSGLFGISILMLSLYQNSKLPPQKTTHFIIKKMVTFKATITASIMGFIAAFLPGFSSSQAAIISQQIVGEIGDEGFLTMVGGINTANMLVSIGTIYALGKARNGAILTVKKLIDIVSITDVLMFISCSLFASGIALILGIKISKIFSKLISKVNYKTLIITVILFIFVLTFFFDAWIGVLILISSTAIGITASELGIGKNHLMGCLIVPVILFFLL